MGSLGRARAVAQNLHQIGNAVGSRVTRIAAASNVACLHDDGGIGADVSEYRSAAGSAAHDVRREHDRGRSVAALLVRVMAPRLVLPPGPVGAAWISQQLDLIEQVERARGV